MARVLGLALFMEAELRGQHGYTLALCFDGLEFPRRMVIIRRPLPVFNGSACIPRHRLLYV